MTNLISNLISVENVCKDYKLGAVTVNALKEINIKISIGEFMTIAGPSGSGKTTLLNLIGCVDVPTEGELVIDGKGISRLSDKELTELRLNTIGFIFQTFNLIPVLNVYDNVEFPLLLKNDLSKNKKERKERVMYFLDKVGLADHLNHRPSELSGGQRQRVAIARALVSKPKIVLADEPTANLDSETGQNIIDLMKKINREDHTTFIFSTHDTSIIKQAQRVVVLKDGHISSDEMMK
ncbi:MAG: ABC transporter ATP-binding protein [Oligoflexia bacterium]|nr:ABC transporter ATP-binding protein [Oligoflexia bacterium]